MPLLRGFPLFFLGQSVYSRGLLRSIASRILPGTPLILAVSADIGQTTQVPIWSGVVDHLGLHGYSPGFPEFCLANGWADPLFWASTAELGDPRSFKLGPGSGIDPDPWPKLCPPHPGEPN